MIYTDAQATAQQTLFTWRGKHLPIPQPPSVVRLYETWPNPAGAPTDYPNKLFHGDNLAVLSHLLDAGQSGQVRMIYADPPYNSGATWPRKVRLRTASAAVWAKVLWP